MNRLKLIDPLVNVANSWTAKVEFTRRAKDELFKAGDDFSRDFSADEMVSILDRNGVDVAVVGIDPQDPAEFILEYPRRYPDRFVFAAEPRLRRGMSALWAVEELCASYPVVAVRAAPMFYDKPACHSFYYPLYVKCLELDIPVCMTTGIPGPSGLPADVQNPMYIDRVLLSLPELKFVMLHGADPWWDVAIRLLKRHRNLTMCTSAWSPRRLPASLLRFLAGSGRQKIMWASDFPVLSIERCVRELPELGLPEDVLKRFTYDNASQVFFGERRARHITHTAHPALESAATAAAD